MWSKIDFFVFKYHPYLWCFYIFYMIGFLGYFVDVYRQKKQRKKENRKFGGYLRWDGVYEVHIGEVKNEREFYSKLTMAIVYCKEKGWPLEFITAHRSFGRYLKDFGEAILIIKQLGSYTRLIMTAGMSDKTVVNFSKYPLLIRLAPDKIHLKQLKNGNYILG